MTAVDERPVIGRDVYADGVRLLAGGAMALSLADHHAIHGSMRLPDGSRLIAEITRSGLLGRGGGGYPAADKLAAIAGFPGPRVVVANGAEGEPTSRKDSVLLSRLPHLVLDGIDVAMRACGADSAVLAVHRGAPELAVLRAAIAERHARVQLHELPRRYVASEASALVRHVNGGEAKPTYGRRMAERGVAGKPTYVGNVETLAHLALIARRGATWFREVGEPAEPGTVLATVSLGGHDSSVVEVTTSATVADALWAGGIAADDLAGAVVGGWSGVWLRPDELERTTMSHTGLAAVGGGLGCAAIVALPQGCCPIAEMSGVARWLAEQSAKQCGPCVHGLPAVADALDRLASGRAATGDAEAFERWARVIPRRGGCAHPDGAMTFVGSGLRVFAAHAELHKRGRCDAADRSPVIQHPRTDPSWL